MQFDLDLVMPNKRSRTLVRDLHRQLRDAIVAGRLVPGTQLPPSRAFARQYSVSRSTAIAVYDLLLSEGFLSARQGAGTFVAERPSVKPTRSPGHRPPLNRRVQAMPPGSAFNQSGDRPLRYDLRLGMPDQSQFRFDLWRRLSNGVLRELSRQPAAYFDSAGPVAFRRAISAHISFARAVGCNVEDVVATTGAQQAFDLIARALVEPGKTVVAVEDPGYPPIRAAFQLAGAKVCPVPVDDQGLVVDRLPKTCRVICITPSHQFPTAVLMSLERRTALLDFAERNGAVIVEDDYDSEFRFGGVPVDALQTLDQSGSVFYVGTFSKCLFPALRLGFVAVPEWARGAILTVKKYTDWHGAIVPQLALARFIEEGHLARHVRRMRKIYAERRTALINAIGQYCSDFLSPVPSFAGLHIATRLDHRIIESRMVAKALAAGIGIEGIGRYADRKSAWSGLAFGYGLCPAADMNDAVRQIAGLVDRH